MALHANWSRVWTIDRERVYFLDNNFLFEMVYKYICHHVTYGEHFSVPESHRVVVDGHGISLPTLISQMDESKRNLPLMIRFDFDRLLIGCSEDSMEKIFHLFE